MRNRLFSAGLTWFGANSSIASVTLRMIASIGSFSSASYTAFRSLNHSRSLCFSSPRKNFSASGRRCAGALDAGFSLVAIAISIVIGEPVRNGARVDAMKSGVTAMTFLILVLAPNWVSVAQMTSKDQNAPPKTDESISEPSPSATDYEIEDWLNENGKELEHLVRFGVDPKVADAF